MLKLYFILIRTIRSILVGGLFCLFLLMAALSLIIFIWINSFLFFLLLLLEVSCNRLYLRIIYLCILVALVLVLFFIDFQQFTEHLFRVGAIRRGFPFKMLGWEWLWVARGTILFMKGNKLLFRFLSLGQVFEFFSHVANFFYKMKLGNFGGFRFFIIFFSGLVRGKEANGLFDDFMWTDSRGPILPIFH